MADALPLAIQAAVESQGVSWGGRARVGSPSELATRLNQALAKFPDYATSNRLAAVIGESAQESDWFCTTTEYGSGQRYAPYVGRGFIQLTWRDNYAAFGQWAANQGLVGYANYFVDNPTVLAGLDWAWYPALWYFAAHGLGSYADQANWNAVSGLINAGSATYVPSSSHARATAIRAALTRLPGSITIQEDDDVDAEAKAWIKETRDRVLGLGVQRYGADGSPNRVLDTGDGEYILNAIGNAVTEVLERSFDRAGGPTGTTNLHQTVAWLDANLNSIRDLINGFQGRIAGLEEALKQVSGGTVDTDTIVAAVTQAVSDAIDAEIDSATVVLNTSDK